MKSVFNAIIKAGNYDLHTILSRIDRYHAEGKLSDAEHDALVSDARAGARPEASVDMSAVLTRLADHERRLAALESGSAVQPEAGAPAEYVAGKVYQHGDRVTWKGKAYTCIAPAGTVCVWSPDDYPAYWEADV